MAWGQEYIRESICMVRYNHDGTVNNYLRLADYDSQASDIPSCGWIPVVGSIRTIQMTQQHCIQ